MFQDATEMLLRLIEWLEIAFGATNVIVPSSSKMDVQSIDDHVSSTMIISSTPDIIPSPPSASGNSWPLSSIVGNPLKNLFHGSIIEERVSSGITINGNYAIF